MMGKTYLAGDVGGTKTLLALCERSDGGGGGGDGGGGGGGELRILREAQFQGGSYASLEAILGEFLAGPQDLAGACFGVAGPVEAGTAKITNLPWTIDARAVSERLGGAPVVLINDLQATALGAFVLPPTAFATLQEPAAPPAPHATIAVIAPGTGLGCSVLVSDGVRYRALPTEAGHADFAAGTDDEIELFRFLRGRYGSHVSVERVLSGDGIGDLYDFARAARGATEPEPAHLAEGGRNAAISHAALAGTDADCVRALAMFVAVLGAEAGNLALRSMATGGVVIGGGIPPRILPLLQTGALIERFNDKGRFRRLTSTLSVRVMLEPRAALFGAAHHATTRGEP
ncbi:MAG TPA: glucokinase [Kofleriaceae bacterium]|nr:glucokinase [Kofleriaceae bacterium]